MYKYNVKISKRALDDMEEIYNYILLNFKSSYIAMRQYNRIATKIEELNFFPKRIKIIDLEPWRSMHLRQLSIDNYSIFFYILDKDVIVTRVLYSASNIEKKLMKSNIMKK